MKISLGVYTDGNGTVYTKNPVARVSKVKECAHLYDVLDDASAIKQGANIKVGDHVDKSLQVRAAETPADGDQIVFVCDVPLLYDESTSLAQAEWQYINKKGKVTKAYEVGQDDVIGVSDYAFTTLVTPNTVPEIGHYVVVDGTRGWKEVTADPTATNGFVGKVIGYEKYTFDTVVLFEVVQNKTI